MQTTAERPEFTPPPEGGWSRSVGLAVLAHLVLVLALSWGLKWKHDDESVAVEAELWASTPQQAAPKPVEAPPAPPPPQPAPPPPAPAPAPAQRDAEIALQQEKERQEQEKAKQEAEAERQRQAAADKRKREEEARRKEEARKQEQEREQERQLAEKRKREAEEKRKEEQQAKARAKQEEQRREKIREEQMARIQGLAGATGPREATGTAIRSAGPSSGYAGRIRARVKPNIVFTDDIPGNPTAVVEVRLAPDGTIVGKRIVKSSGVRTWDDAVLRALDRTEVLPRDVDGRVVTPMELVFRPKD
ncbi:cell envelope integrity protein TolA [Ramlibacter sp.]|uniref:cell envelope integrity protein TolA n=1 Tax=Ramlibacter sp. TaxID=1917967 RepID=UPI002FC8B352